MFIRGSLRALVVAVVLVGCGDDEPTSGSDASVSDGSTAEDDSAVDGSGDAGDGSTFADSAMDGSNDASLDAGNLFAGLDPVVTVSVDHTGQIAKGDARPFAISGNGRFTFSQAVVAFVPEDTNETNDVYVHDVVGGTTVLISRTTTGAAAEARRPSVSNDGRYVTFTSGSPDILPSGEDQNGVNDGFVVDRDLDQDGIFDEFEEEGATRMTRVTVATDGQEGDDLSAELSISASGRFVVFVSRATNLTADVVDGSVTNVFVRDRDTDEDGIFDEVGAVATVLVSREPDGSPSSEPCAMRSAARAITDDGRFVLYRGLGDNLVADDDNGRWDIFVVDRDADEDGVFDEEGQTKTVRVNVASDGSQSEGDDVNTADISADGRWVFFQSGASNLVAGDANGEGDVFVHDRDVDEDGIYDEPGAIDTSFLVTADGNALAGVSAAADSSDDGRFVAFSTGAEDLEDPKNAVFDVFVVDRDPNGTGKFDSPPEVARVSVNANGAALTDESFNPRISADGVAIAFTTFAPELGSTGITGGDDYAQTVWTLNPFLR